MNKITKEQFEALGQRKRARPLSPLCRFLMGLEPQEAGLVPDAEWRAKHKGAILSFWSKKYGKSYQMKKVAGGVAILRTK